MATIESKKVVVPATAQQITEFLTNTDNIIKLLPESKISDWKSDGKTCSFKVQGAYNIGLSLVEAANNKIQFNSTERSPFPFKLDVFLNEKEGATEAHQICEAQINPFLEMMVKGPLKNLFDYMADQLTKHIN